MPDSSGLRTDILTIDMQFHATVFRAALVRCVVSHRFTLATSFTGEFVRRKALTQQIEATLLARRSDKRLVISIRTFAVGMTDDLDAHHIGVAQFVHQRIELLCRRGQIGFVECEQDIAGIAQGDDFGLRRRFDVFSDRILRQRAATVIDRGVGRGIRATVAAVEHAIVVFIAILGVTDQSAGKIPSAAPPPAQPPLSMAPRPPPTKPPRRLQTGHVR